MRREIVSRIIEYTHQVGPIIRLIMFRNAVRRVSVETITESE